MSKYYLEYLANRGTTKSPFLNGGDIRKGVGFGCVGNSRLANDRSPMLSLAHLIDLVLIMITSTHLYMMAKKLDGLG